jgi:hypothetical protein
MRKLQTPATSINARPLTRNEQVSGSSPPRRLSWPARVPRSGNPRLPVAHGLAAVVAAIGTTSDSIPRYATKRLLSTKFPQMPTLWLSWALPTVGIIRIVAQERRCRDLAPSVTLSVNRSLQDKREGRRGGLTLVYPTTLWARGTALKGALWPRARSSTRVSREGEVAA